MTAGMGVDGCKGGWAAVWRAADGSATFAVFRAFSDLIEASPADAMIAVDMPIGLPDHIYGTGRVAEQSVRRFMTGKTSSVFSMVARTAVEAGTDYVDTCNIARAHSTPPKGISQQGFNILPKVRELDMLMRQRPDLKHKVFETHPEVALCVLAGRPVLAPKKTAQGHAERRALIARHGLDLPDPLPRLAGAQADDLMDAAICLLVAERLMSGAAVSFPSPPGVDGHGLPIAIWA